jgi:hypothetical protein
MKRLILGAMLVAASCAPTAVTPTSTPGTSVATVAPATTTPAATASTAQPAAAGTITGLVAYPAEGHPAITIIAFSKTDRSIFFLVDIPQATVPPKTPYTITGVRPGTYNVFAYAMGNDRAGGAYTQYVKCGLNASCSDHSLIDVTVRAGETVRDIDVSDWYGPTDTFPPRPR